MTESVSMVPAYQEKTNVKSHLMKWNWFNIKIGRINKNLMANSLNIVLSVHIILFCIVLPETDIRTNNSITKREPCGCQTMSRII